MITPETGTTQEAGQLAPWNKALAEAIRAIRQPAFGMHLTSALAAVAPYDVCMIFGYTPKGGPLALHHNMEDARAAIIVHDYLVGPYLLDPFYEAARMGWIGLGRLKDFAPDLFYSSEYFHQHYERTRIRDEVGFFIPLPQGASVVVSITRSLEEPLFSAWELGRLAGAEPVIRALCEAHWRDLHALLSSRESDAGAGEQMDRALGQMGAGLLTPREIEIVSLILKGHSNNSIAGTLMISVGTVKIHRKNIYHKLGLSSQAELFTRFIDHLKGHFSQASPAV